MSFLHFEFAILNIVTQPLYQRISIKATMLHQLGLCKRSIAFKLNVDEKTVSKAIQWVKEQ